MNNRVITEFSNEEYIMSTNRNPSLIPPLLVIAACLAFIAYAI
jgi:hypothetical protein